MTWLLGLLVLSAWASITYDLGRPLPFKWWAATILWVLLGASVKLWALLRWVTGKVGAGALESLQAAGASAPVKKEGG